MTTVFPTSNKLREGIKILSDGGVTTRFNFINEVGGIRRGYLYGLLSTPSAGKSTLLRSIITDVAENEKVYIWLSEEPVLDYSIGLLASRESVRKENIYFFSERSLDAHERKDIKVNISKWFKYFQDKIITSGAAFVFFDNLTTSSFYDSLKTEDQSFFLTLLNKMAEEFNIAVFYVCHTEKSIKENNSTLIDGSCVRGSNQTFMMAQFFFVMQKFTSSNSTYVFIRIEKHRIVPVQNKWFSLLFRENRYFSDRSVNFSKVREAFQVRDTLTMSKQKTIDNFPNFKVVENDKDL